MTFNASPPTVNRGPEAERVFQELRVARAREVLGSYAPATIPQDHLTKRTYAQVVLNSIQRALDAELSGARSYRGINALQYSDGAPMVSSTMVVYQEEDLGLIDSMMLDDWEFFQPDWPKSRLIDMPVLSAFERLRVEALLSADSKGAGPENDDSSALPVRKRLLLAASGWLGKLADSPPEGSSPADDGSDEFENFEMPEGRLGRSTEVLESFRRFYRLYPQFARIEL